MDLSDGLADAVRQVADSSRVGVRIDAESLPIDPAAHAWWTAKGVDPIIAALSGGDDYELVLTTPARKTGALRGVMRHISDPPLTKIGVLTKDPAERVLVRGGKEEAIPGGFEHFAHR